MCPCPQCLTPKNQMDDLGSNNDMQQRQVLACMDIEERQNKVAVARHLIYQQHYVISTPQVEALLKPESLLPTKVSVFFDFDTIVLDAHWCLEHVFRKVESIGL